MKMKHKDIVYGVGVNDYSGKLSVNGIRLVSYRAWHNMLRRCYDPRMKSDRPSYDECEVCDEWKSFSTFKEWFDSNYVEGQCLDKDILIQGSKIYSPSTCCFVPIRINILLTEHKESRGLYPIGVSYEPKWNRYKACISLHGKIKHLGYYCSSELAHLSWIEAKKKYVSECAITAYSNKEISEIVKDALLNRLFE